MDITYKGLKFPIIKNAEYWAVRVGHIICMTHTTVPCKVTSISFVKTGKHGGAKKRIKAQNILINESYEWIAPVCHTVIYISIDTLYEQYYEILSKLDIDDNLIKMICDYLC